MALGPFTCNVCGREYIIADVHIGKWPKELSNYCTHCLKELRELPDKWREKYERNIRKEKNK